MLSHGKFSLHVTGNSKLLLYMLKRGWGKTEKEAEVAASLNIKLDLEASVYNDLTFPHSEVRVAFEEMIWPLNHKPFGQTLCDLNFPMSTFF